MSDMISRSELLKLFPVDMGNPLWHFTGIRAAIEAAPAIDAVPVVRCKDCKWRFSSNCPMFHEELTYSEDDGYEWIDRDNTSDDGFCEQGARMDGEENAAD